MTQNQIIAEIKNVVSSHLGETDVMLFGSRAKGSSDVDFLMEECQRLDHQSFEIDLKSLTDFDLVGMKSLFPG